MVTIIFESHATTYDNEKGVASGFFDVKLSPSGVEKAKQLGKRRAGESFDVIFCSDLQRSYKTAEIAFGNRFAIFKDARLRECDYGDWEHRSKDFVEQERIHHITKPFPNGESYNQALERMKSFVEELRQNCQRKTVLVIGHRATQYGLEFWTTKQPIKQIMSHPWQWQPGWQYELL